MIHWLSWPSLWRIFRNQSINEHADKVNHHFLFFQFFPLSLKKLVVYCALFFPFHFNVKQHLSYTRHVRCCVKCNGSPFTYARRTFVSNCPQHNVWTLTVVVSQRSLGFCNSQWPIAIHCLNFSFFFIELKFDDIDKRRKVKRRNIIYFLGKFL